MALPSWSLYSRERIDKKMRGCVIKYQTVINLTKNIVRNEKGDKVGLRNCLLTNLKKVIESQEKAIQAKGIVLTLKDSYQEFKCLANDNFVGFCKMKIGSSVGNYGSHSVQIQRKVCLFEFEVLQRFCVCVFPQMRRTWKRRTSRGKERAWEVGRKAVVAAERSGKQSVIRKLWHKGMACPSCPLPPNKLRKQYQCLTIHLS